MAAAGTSLLRAAAPFEDALQNECSLAPRGPLWLRALFIDKHHAVVGAVWEAEVREPLMYLKRGG